jgi:hypothetical protein
MVLFDVSGEYLGNVVSYMLQIRPIGPDRGSQEP